MKKPRKGFTSRRDAAYSAWRANNTTVKGQIQSTAVRARPVMLLVVARWITSAGTTRKPASAEMVTKGRGRVRTWAMRAASTTFQARMTATNRKSRSGRKARISAPDPGIAGDGRGSEATHEDVERFRGERDVRGENVHEGETA